MGVNSGFKVLACRNVYETSCLTKAGKLFKKSTGESNFQLPSLKGRIMCSSYRVNLLSAPKMWIGHSIKQ